jgi:hypothetical protein
MKALVCRSGFMGDVLLSSSSLRGIRQKHPDCHLVYSTWAQNVPMIAANPNLSEIRAPGRYMVSDYLPYVVDFRHEAKMPRFKGDNDPLVYWGYVHAMQCRDKGLLDEMESYKPELYLEQSNMVDVSEFDKFCVINTWSTNGKNWRLWSHSQWVELVKNLKKMGYKVIQLGGKTDPPVKGATHLCGRTSLLQSASMVAQANLAIVIDSLVGHMAHSRIYKRCKESDTIELLSDSTRCVLLAGPVPWQNVVPTNARAIAVTSDYSECGGKPCGHSHAKGAGRQICQYQNACMRDITIEQVLEATDELQGEIDVH